MSATGKTVLLVEDNEDNRIVYSTILRHFGYQVTEALNGEEGIAKAKSEKPDLILMDISIPIIDGWEATQVLKHDPETRSIPIIALTAHALASDREKAMEVGCDGYLAKPCEPRAVVAEVQRFLGRGSRAPPVPPPGSEPRRRVALDRRTPAVHDTHPRRRRSRGQRRAAARAPRGTRVPGRGGA
jgi:CheY-like chemotaxis protein